MTAQEAAPRKPSLRNIILLKNQNKAYKLISRRKTKDEINLRFAVENLSYGDLGWVACKSWYSRVPTVAFRPIAVKLKPRVHAISMKDNETELKFVILGYPLADLQITIWKNLEKFFESDPEDSVTYKVNGTKIRIRDQNLDFYEKIIFLSIMKFGLDSVGDYILRACNGMGCDSAFYNLNFASNVSELDPPANSDPNPGNRESIGFLFSIIGAGVFAVLFGVAVVVGFFCYNTHRRLQKHQDNIEISDVYVPLQPKKVFISVLCDKVPIVEKDQLDLVREIGQGAFGKVYLANLNWTDEETVKVAVKRLKEMGSQQVHFFRQEAELLVGLRHPNVLQFHGVLIDNSDLLLVFEFMDLGDLKTYLCQRSPEAQMMSARPSLKFGLSIQERLHIAIQIGRGLMYLEKKKVVHRDLAARNCLLHSCQTPPLLKLSDFGMSRSVYGIPHYKIANIRPSPLPVRWLPPESLSQGKFSKDSDIWSFGVVLWEIFSFGKLPYSHLGNADVVARVSQGTIRLQRPEGCPQDVYQLMKSCWEEKPEQRVRVSVAKQKLKKILKERLEMSQTQDNLDRPPAPLLASRSCSRLDTKTESQKNKISKNLRKVKYLFGCCNQNNVPN